MKYLISSDEREAENNPLWGEVAEAGSEIQSLIHPPVQPTPALVADPWVLLLLLPIALPTAQQGLGAPAARTLCSQAGMPGNEALGHKPNAQLRSSRDLCGLCCPLFPNYFCPSGPEGAKQNHNVFLIQ